MKQPLQAEAFNFDRILSYSLYAALISFVLVVVSALLSHYFQPLWNAVFIVGIPYFFL